MAAETTTQNDVGTYVYTGNAAPKEFVFTLAATGAGCPTAAGAPIEVEWTQVLGNASTMNHKVLTMTQSGATPNVADGFAPCTAFTPSYLINGLQDVIGPASEETQHRILYVTLDAVGTSEDHRPASGTHYANISVDATWTAHGY